MQHSGKARGLRSMFLDMIDKKAKRLGQADRHGLFLPRVIKNFGFQEGGLTVLDIGVGNGYPLSYRSPHITKYGTDLSDHLADALSAIDVKLLICNAGSDRVQLPDASVDIVMLNHLIEHVNEYDFMLKEIRRILKPGGGLYIRTPDIYKVREHFYDDYTHVKPYSVPGLRHLASAYNFEMHKTLASDHPRILMDLMTDGKFSSLIFCGMLPGGREIETYWIKR